MKKKTNPGRKPEKEKKPQCPDDSNQSNPNQSFNFINHLFISIKQSPSTNPNLFKILCIHE
jgi:hypothetical protein